MSDFKTNVLDLHAKHTGKLECLPTMKITSKEDLSMAYTPGVAIPCLAIKDNPDLANQYTIKGKMVAIITDASAVLGLGSLPPQASLPVMEGKALLLHQFSGIQAYPLALNTKDPNKIIETIQHIAVNFSAIMLEDIASPQCVYIEETLQECLDIPVFHDDQHGTAIVLSAALINALEIVKKNITDIKVVVCGLGAAGCAITKLLHALGVSQIYGYDIQGVVSKRNINARNPVIQSLVEQKTLKVDDQSSNLQELLVGKDVFIGVSTNDLLTQEMIQGMAEKSIIFAMANPKPEIDPSLAWQAGAAVVGTGLSSDPNQINNVLVFPGLMKGVLKAKVKRITQPIKIATAKAIASMVKPSEREKGRLLPDIFDKKVVTTIEKAILETIKKD